MDRFGAILKSLIIGASIATLVLLVILLNQGNNLASTLSLLSQCPYVEDGEHCFTGNACIAGLVTIACQGLACAPYSCEYKPLPDGSCCNFHDFCSLPDPSKKCLAGQCVSANVTLCKGFCTVDADCNGTFGVPLLPGLLFGAAYCINNACVTVAQSQIPFVSCLDLLNVTTPVQRSIVACLESDRQTLEVSAGSYLETCYWNYACSQGVEFSQPLRRRRFGEVTTTLEKAQLQRHFLPAKHWTSRQYLEVNEHFNQRLMDDLKR
jgi:hypothetical protein